MITNFILHPIYKMSLFIISAHIECWEETKQEQKVLKSKVEASEEVL